MVELALRPSSVPLQARWALVTVLHRIPSIVACVSFTNKDRIYLLIPGWPSNQVSRLREGYWCQTWTRGAVARRGWCVVCGIKGDTVPCQSASLAVPTRFQVCPNTAKHTCSSASEKWSRIMRLCFCDCVRVGKKVIATIYQASYWEISTYGPGHFDISVLRTFLWKTECIRFSQIPVLCETNFWLIANAE